mgnify:CR=1 FL=1
MIARCASFAVVCQAAPLCEHNTQDYDARGAAYLSLNEMFARKINLVPAEVRRMIAFLRVWCLVELNAALRKGELVVIMKAGKMDKGEYPRGVHPGNVCAVQGCSCGGGLIEGVHCQTPSRAAWR